MNKASFLYACLAVLLFLPRSSDAFILEQYSTREKLISDIVYHSFRDSKGYVWFCTDKGLSRFDGTGFKHFSASDGTGDNEIFNMYEDKAGRIWVFTYNGEPAYYFQGKFHNSSNDSLLKKLPVLPFICDMAESGDALYIGYVGGDVLKIKNNRITWLRRVTNPNDKFWQFSRQDQCLVAIQTDQRCAIRNDSMVCMDATRIRNAYTQGSLVFVQKGTTLELTEAGKSLWTYNDREWLQADILDAYCDHLGLVFISTRNGLVIIDRKTGSKKRIMSNTSITSVRQDIYNNYWITTLGQGVFCLNAGLLDAGSLHTGAAGKVICAAGTLFLQKVDSLYCISGRNGQLFATHLATIHEPNVSPLYLDPEKLIYTINRDGLYIYYRKTQTTEQLKFRINPFSVFPWHGDTLIVIDYSGIHQVSVRKGATQVHTGIKSKRKIRRIIQAADRRIYYITGGMLCVYDPAANGSVIVDSFKYDNTVECLFIHGPWLVACDNMKQIHVYDRSNYRRRFTIPSDYIVYEQQQLDTGRYLLKTQSGFIIVQTGHSLPNVISCMTLEYPFQSPHMQELYVTAGYVTGKTGNELIYLKKSLLDDSFSKPRLYVDELNINGRKYTGNRIQLKNTTACDIKIKLSAVSNKQSLYYTYRIRTGDHWGTWNRTATPDLNMLLSGAGLYTIEITAVSPNNKRSVPVYIILDITPPFFRSGPFYILLGLIFLCLLALLVLLYLHKKKKAFKRELNHMQLEHKAINALLNPHFIFNVVNNIQNLINSDAKTSASNYLATMAKMIRQNMENLQFDLIPVRNELELIDNYIRLQNLRFNDRITLKLTDHIPDESDLYIPPLLLHTFVENAIIHGIKSDQSPFVIEIDLLLTINDYVHVRITDNGDGLQKDRDHHAGKTSLGIDFNRKRLQRLSGFYKVDSQVSIQDRSDGRQGTEVVVIFYARLAQLMKTKT